MYHSVTCTSQRVTCHVTCMPRDVSHVVGSIMSLEPDMVHFQGYSSFIWQGVNIFPIYSDVAYLYGSSMSTYMPNKIHGNWSNSHLCAVWHCLAAKVIISIRCHHLRSTNFLKTQSPGAQSTIYGQVFHYSQYEKSFKLHHGYEFDVPGYFASRELECQWLGFNLPGLTLTELYPRIEAISSIKLDHRSSICLSRTSSIP